MGIQDQNRMGFPPRSFTFAYFPSALQQTCAVQVTWVAERRTSSWPSLILVTLWTKYLWYFPGIISISSPSLQASQENLAPGSHDWGEKPASLLHPRGGAHPTKTWAVTFGVEGKGLSGRENNKADQLSQKERSTNGLPRGQGLKSASNTGAWVHSLVWEDSTN